MAGDGTGMAAARLGLPGFWVLAVAEGCDEVVITIETVLDRVGCAGCGVRAEAQDRMPVELRDLSCFGRPARLVWVKRRWRCTDARLPGQHLDPVLDPRRRPGGAHPAGAEAARQVGQLARPVSRVAAELDVCWWTVMNAVIEHGTPLVDDPERIGAVRHLGVDETSFLATNRTHAMIYAKVSPRLSLTKRTGMGAYEI